jgi:hypothetical protein
MAAFFEVSCETGVRSRVRIGKSLKWQGRIGHHKLYIIRMNILDENIPEHQRQKKLAYSSFSSWFRGKNICVQKILHRNDISRKGIKDDEIITFLTYKTSSHLGKA